LFVGRHITNACEFEQLGHLIRLAHRCGLHILDQEYS
jgi:hypothetical protein